MNDKAADVLLLLASSPAPLSLTEIAAGLQVSNDGPLRAAVLELHRDDQLDRHDSIGEGIRYSVSGREAHPEPPAQAGERVAERVAAAPALSSATATQIVADNNRLAPTDTRIAVSCSRPAFLDC